MKKQPDEDADLLKSILFALMAGKGRGGLTWAAGKLGITPTNLHKRLASATTFDAPTLRAALLIMGSKSEHFNDGGKIKPLSSETVGKYVVEFYEQDGEIVPAWRPK